MLYKLTYFTGIITTTLIKFKRPSYLQKLITPSGGAIDKRYNKSKCMPIIYNKLL